VISAGAFNTPALLQLSGIGDRNVLTPLGIPTIVHNPSVGQNMSDHVLVPNQFFVNNTATYDDIFRNQKVFDENMAEWKQNKSSTPFSADVCNTIGWLRLPPTDPIFLTTPDPSPGVTSAHYEYIFKVSQVRRLHEDSTEHLAELLHRPLGTSLPRDGQLYEHHNKSHLTHLS